MSPNTSSILRKFGVVGLIVICSLILTTQFTYAQDPSQGESPGSGLTPGEVQGGKVEGALLDGADTQDSYSGCVYVWDVWTEDNSGASSIFEPGDDIYLYMWVDNECYPFISPSTLFWWELWSPGSVSQLSHQQYFTVYTGGGIWYLYTTFTADPPMGEWLYKGTTSYIGGTNSDTWTFEVRPKAPTGVNATDGTHADKVRVSWSASSGATSYRVLRATSSGGTYSQIGTPSGTSFDDTSATPGTTYWYKVRGCVSVGCGGYSNYNSGWRSTGSGTKPSVNPILFRSPAKITKGSPASGPNQWFAQVVPGKEGDAGDHFNFVVWLHIPVDWTVPWANEYSFTGDFSNATLSPDWTAQSWVGNINNCAYGGPAEAGFKWRAFRGPQQTLPALANRLNNRVNLRGGLGVPSGETSDIYGGVRVIVGSYYDFDIDGTPDRYVCDHVAATNISVP